MADQDNRAEVVVNDAREHAANGTRARVETGGTQREEFGATAMTKPAETSIAAMAASAKATIEARYIMAMQRPRSWMTVRERVLAECRRPRFAEVARYHKPIGKGIVGPSIRFAEVAMRCMGNLDVETSTIYDDDTKRIVRVSVVDLESNLPFKKDIVIDKTVERSQIRDGQECLGVRVNSAGRRTYLVRATEDDLLNKENALVSKAMRTNALRLLPGDILDEAMDEVVLTQKTQDAKDPAAARKRIVDGFARIGVTTQMIAEYLGHPADTMTPDEIADLRGVGLAIKDGEAKWADAVELRRKERDGDSESAPAPLKDRVKAKAEAAAAPKPASAAAPAQQILTPEQREAEEAERALSAKEAKEKGQAK